MATEAEGKGQEGAGAGDELTVVDCIKAIAAHNARADLTTEHQMTLFLKSWWSSTYNRPLKDPLLESYTLEELLYEFYDKMERQKAAEERVAQDADKMEVAKEREVLDWAEAEEKKELEEMQRSAALASQKKTDPTKDPANVKWMNEQMSLAKQAYGDSFGEDVEASFDEE
jgi:hypothetical protein